MHRLFQFSIGCFFALSSQAQSLSGAMPIDAKATPETKNLYINLKRAATQGLMFGHQDDLGYGVGWRGVPGRSDVKDVVGEYPAVFGWDLGMLELDSLNEIDGIPFARQRQFVQQVYAQGGINTFSWHMRNPLNPKKTSWDKQDSTIRHLFDDRKARRRYKSWLKKEVAYLKTLKGPNGEAIPVIFRPFHEHNGSWFWWGKGHSTPDEYKKLWRFTVDFLRKKRVHNLLYAYSTDKFWSRQEYLERYPGDDYVDLLGFDVYHRPNPQDTIDRFVPDTRRMVETLQQIGQEKSKPYAITEIGLERIPIADWWTNVLMPVAQNTGLSYALMWRNGRPDHYYAPYPGQTSADNFKAFSARPDVLLEKKAKNLNVYQKN
jgi:mannan endo-1,4-beta-mannosidase